jgi:hypothetical protein
LQFIPALQPEKLSSPRTLSNEARLKPLNQAGELTKDKPNAFYVAGPLAKPGVIVFRSSHTARTGFLYRWKSHYLMSADLKGVTATYRYFGVLISL